MARILVRRYPRELLVLAVALILQVDQARGFFPSDPPTDRIYVEIPMGDNVASGFRNRILASQENDLFFQVLNNLIKDPQKYNLDPAMVSRLDLSNPFSRMLLQQWFVNSNGKITPESVGQLKEQLENSLDPKRWLEKNGLSLMRPDGLRPMLRPQNIDSIPRFPNPEKEDPLGKWMQKVFRNAERSGLNDYLNQSAEWKEGMLKLGVSGVSAPPATGLWEEVVGRWGLADRIKITWSDRTFAQLRNLSMPDLPRVSLNSPSFDMAGNWNNWQIPGLSGSSSFGGGEIGLWLVFTLALVVIGWRFFKSQLPSRSSGPGMALVVQGPFNPGPVETREQLISTFEKLAIWRLGMVVHTWNHRMIAAHLAPADSLQGQAAVQLGNLYELARYTEGPQPLGPNEQALARHSLILLTTEAGGSGGRQ